ncbi:MAG: hypothetical protein ACM3ZF_09270 [Mycobacterium leprae]
MLYLLMLVALGALLALPLLVQAVERRLDGPGSDLRRIERG